MNVSLKQLIPATLLTLSVGAAQATVPTHLYELNNSYADSLAGPALSNFGGTLGATSYSFGADQGLFVDNAVGQDVYTIDTSFVFDSASARNDCSVSGGRKPSMRRMGSRAKSLASSRGSAVEAMTTG